MTVRSVADRAPQVLLDLALAQRFGQPSLVVVQRALRDAGGDQGGQPERLLSSRLRIADPQLHGAECVVGPDAPPELRGLDDRVRADQQVDEIRVRPPAPERLMDAAAGEGTGEDLRAHRVEAGVAAVETG